MSKIKNGGLDQYGAKPFEPQQFGTAGVEGVNLSVVQELLSKSIKTRSCILQASCCETISVLLRR